MRITLVVNNADEGSETFLHSMAGVLRNAGHEVTVHALLAGRAAMPSPSAFRVQGRSLPISRALPPVRSIRFGPKVGRLIAGDPSLAALVWKRAMDRFGAGSQAARAAALAAPILATRPDVVHLAFSPIGVALTDALDLLDGIRIVVSCRGTGELVRPILDAGYVEGLCTLLERADAVHVVSAAVGSALAGFGADPARITLIRPGVDTDHFRPRAGRPPFRSPARLVAVGRLHWIKSTADLIDAVGILERRGRAVSLTLVGDGPEADPIRFRVHALGLDAMVKFAGSVHHEDVRELVESADIVVSASLSEGTSNSVLEAMALEMPVVCSAVGGMTEVMDDGIDGLLVPPGAPDAIANAVARLVDEPNLAVELGQHARARVVNELSAAVQADAILAMYSGLNGRSGIGPATVPQRHNTAVGKR